MIRKKIDSGACRENNQRFASLANEMFNFFQKIDVSFDIFFSQKKFPIFFFLVQVFNYCQKRLFFKRGLIDIKFDRLSLDI